MLAGCGLGPGPMQRCFLFEAALPRTVEAPAGRDLMLLVAPTTATGFYDTQEIIYSRTPGQRAYYQYSSWTDAPYRTLGALLAMRIERSGAFRGVAETTSSVRGNLMLRTHLDEIYHDASSIPGSARIALTAELSDPAGRHAGSAYIRRVGAGAFP